jgi:glycerate 2-kinase
MMTPSPTNDPKAFLRAVFNHAVAAVDPRRVAAGYWPKRTGGRLIILGAGKAAGAMAQAAETHYGADIEGLVVTRDGYEQPTQVIRVLNAGHPMPDERSVVAAQQILALAHTARPHDQVVCLWSGGASALMALPPAGLSLKEKQRITSALLSSGAGIDAINCVRKHLSGIKGGRLALACGDAPVTSLIVSDVVGDDPSVIASGPTVADPTTCADALAIVDQFRISIPPEARRILLDGAWESPKVLPSMVANVIVARPADAFRAAHQFATDIGLKVLDLGDRFDGLAGDVAGDHARVVQQIRQGLGSLPGPCLVLSGGEAVVRVTGDGLGGPNTEFALALAQQLYGVPNVFALACDSDGSDGKGRHAGAIIDPDTLARAKRLGLSPTDAQARNDTAAFFEAIGDLVVTGPTYTNVNDFRAILVL